MNPNNNQIYLLIGPPKTGTTSLQYWLMENSGNEYIYIGCRQPRSIYLREDLSFKIYQLACKNEIDIEELQIVHQVIDKRLESGRPLILSEELFLHTPRWPTLIKNLRVVLGKYKLKIAISNRNMIFVIPSYYAETYDRLPFELKENYRAFIKSGWVTQYNIEKLLKCLTQNNYYMDEIWIFSFNELIDGNLTLNKIFNEKKPEKVWNSRIVVGNKNQKSEKAESLSEYKIYTVNMNYFKKLPLVLRKALAKIDSVLSNKLTQNNLFFQRIEKQIKIPVLHELTSSEIENQEFIRKFHGNS